MKPTDKKIILEETRCLTPEELLRFRDNTMDASSRHRAEMHMVDCPLCSEAAEGIMFVSSASALDKVRDDVKQFSEKGHTTVPARKYWLAAASLAGIAVLAAYMFSEYEKVQHPAVALQKEPVTVPAAENSDAFVAAEPQAPVVSSPVTSSIQAAEAAPPAPLQQTTKEVLLEADIVAEETKDAAEELNEAPAEHTAVKAAPDLQIADNEAALFSKSQVSNQASYPKLLPPTDLKKTRSKTSSKDSKKADSQTSDGNVTYVHNMKVIDYHIDELQSPDAGTATGNSTEPKYENRNQKEAAKAVSDETVRKTTYLDLISVPVAQYKDKKYEAAIEGFDEMLLINPSDRNAMFYKGMSLYHLKRYTESIASLSGPANDVAGPFRDEARFYMAKAYKESGNTAIATDLFSNLVKEGGFYAPRAAEELKDLR